MAEDLVTIYEATNDDLKELYVGWTADDLETLMSRQCDDPPAPIAHWRKGQRISYRTVDFSFPRSEVPSILERYAAAAVPPGWRLLR